MAKVILKKKIDTQNNALSEVKTYARKIWLAGLGAYAKVGSEGSEYFKELVKTGQHVESKGAAAKTEGNTSPSGKVPPCPIQNSASKNAPRSRSGNIKVLVSAR